MRSRLIKYLVVPLVGFSHVTFAQTQSTAAEYDLIIRGGTVFDGTGSEGRVADVGIIDDRIIAIGNLASKKARTEKDARGLYVTPGFISVHDHSAPEAYRFPVNLLTQGITTAITNPDGGGPIDFIKQISVPMGLNYGAYIGFNSVWGEVMGADDKRASPAEIKQMQNMVADAMAKGAFGLSAGLDYKPGFWANTDEVIAVSKAAASSRTGFTNHERVYPGNGYSSMAGMRETVEIGEKSGLMPVITHMKLQGADQGKANEALALATDGAKRGLVVGMDAYPYTFGSTSLEQLTIPAWAQEGGEAAMLERFKNPTLRKRIDAETNDQLAKRWGGAGGVYLSEMKRELTDIIDEMGGISAGEAIMRLLEKGERRVLLRFGTEADQEAIVSHPLTAVSCDCGATTSFTGHPRNWGSYPKFLGRYVREKKLVNWGEAVRKMTALPATMIGLTERGYLLPGMIADVTVFNPETVIDRATMAEPYLPSAGIQSVIINGKIALNDGMVSISTPGKPLFRSVYEPARPMNFDINRSVKVNGVFTNTSTEINIDVRQQAGSMQPTGKVTIGGLPGGEITMIPSILQTSKGWASMTGVTFSKGRKPTAITVIAEERDPSSSYKPSITVILNGTNAVKGMIKEQTLVVTQE